VRSDPPPRRREKASRWRDGRARSGTRWCTERSSACSRRSISPGARHRGAERELRTVAAALEKLDGERDAPAPARLPGTISPTLDQRSVPCAPRAAREPLAEAALARGVVRRGDARVEASGAKMPRLASRRRRAARQLGVLRLAAPPDRPRRPDAPRVQQIGERAATALIDSRFRSASLEHAPREHAAYARVAGVATWPLSYDRGLAARGLRREHPRRARSRAGHRAPLERLVSPVATREVVQDRGVRDTDVARDVWSRVRLRDRPPQAVLGSVEDQPLRLFGAAAHPPRFARTLPANRFALPLYDNIVSNSVYRPRRPHGRWIDQLTPQARTRTGSAARRAARNPRTDRSFRAGVEVGRLLLLTILSIERESESMAGRVRATEAGAPQRRRGAGG